jgi:hypothetical protein
VTRPDYLAPLLYQSPEGESKTRQEADQSRRSKKIMMITLTTNSQQIIIHSHGIETKHKER